MSLWKKLLWAQLQPMRIVSYLYLVGTLIPPLALKWETAFFVFEWISLLIASNIAFIAWLERNHLRKIGFRCAVLWLVVISAGIIFVEFTGISIHTLTRLPFEISTEILEYWNRVGFVFTFLGGSILEAVYYFSSKLSGKTVSPRVMILALIVLVLLIVALMLTLYFNVLPKTGLLPAGKILNYL